MFQRLSRWIDKFITVQGEWTSLLILPLLLVVIYEVLMRYGFNAPTVWGFEATTFLYGLHFMFGISYTDVTGGHVKVDIFTQPAPKKVRAFLGALTTFVFFLPATACLTWYSFEFAFASAMDLERNPTSWAPPIYPIKIIMALCLLFLLLQGISNLIRDLSTLFGKRDTETKEA